MGTASSQVHIRDRATLHVMLQRRGITTGAIASEVWRLRMLLMLSADVMLAALGSTVSVLHMLGVLMLLPVVIEELS